MFLTNVSEGVVCLASSGIENHELTDGFRFA